MFTTTIQGKTYITFEEKLQIARANNIKFVFDEEKRIIKVLLEKTHNGFLIDQLIGFRYLVEYSDAPITSMAIRRTLNEALDIFAGHLFEVKNGLTAKERTAISSLSIMLYFLEFEEDKPSKTVINSAIDFLGELKTHPLIKDILLKISQKISYNL